MLPKQRPTGESLMALRGSSCRCDNSLRCFLHITSSLLTCYIRQISVSGVNVWLETWRGHCHPDEVQENLNTGEAGGAVKRYGELLSHPQSLPHWPSTGEAQQVDAVLENGRHHAMDSNMSHTGTSHSPAKQRTVEQIRKMEVLKQWGATVIVLVSSRPLEGQPLPRGSVVPAWKKESDASVKLAHRQASQNNGWPEYEEGADRNCEADECSEEDKEAKSQKAPARRRLNPSETVSWIKLLVQSLRPLISGPAALGGRKKARKQGKTLSNENSQHCFLRLDVELNAAILQLQPDSVACLLRILKRLSFVQKFSCHWQVGLCWGCAC